MTFQFEWLGLAEGSAQDGRGVVALLGLNQNVVLAKDLPVSTKRVVVILLEENAEGIGPSAEDGDLSIAVSVLSPSGKTLLSNRQKMPLGERPWRDIPGSIQLVAEFSLNFDERGTYVIQCEVEDSSGRVESRAKNLYVVDPATRVAAPTD